MNQLTSIVLKEAAYVRKMYRSLSPHLLMNGFRLFRRDPILFLEHVFVETDIRILIHTIAPYVLGSCILFLLGDAQLPFVIVKSGKILTCNVAAFLLLVSAGLMASSVLALKVVFLWLIGLKNKSVYVSLFSLYPIDIQEKYSEDMISVMESDCHATLECYGTTAYYRKVTSSTIALLWDIACVHWSRWALLKIFGLS